jgi:hypothetical protein
MNQRNLCVTFPHARVRNPSSPNYANQVKCAVGSVVNGQRPLGECKWNE